jgi:hypothetical protein
MSRSRNNKGCAAPCCSRSKSGELPARDLRRDCDPVAEAVEYAELPDWPFLVPLDADLTREPK